MRNGTAEASRGPDCQPRERPGLRHFRKGAVLRHVRRKSLTDIHSGIARAVTGRHGKVFLDFRRRPYR